MLRATCTRRNLTVATMSKRALSAEYAVRGKIAVRANEIEAQLAKGPAATEKFNFSTLIKLNTGNPQNHEQKAWSFPHQVCALLEAPELIDSGAAASVFPPDVIERAKYIQKHTAGQLGGYTGTKGFNFIRTAIADFIEARDNASYGKALPKIDIENIFLSNGASGAVTPLMTALVGSEADGIMIPIPQYPLYTAQLALLGGTVVPYYLDEAKAWSFTVAELEKAYGTACDNGVAPRAFVLINPGNPTGQVLDRKVLEEIVEWAHKRKIMIISDEVYQENIYAPGKKFCSMREVVLTAPGNIANEVQLASLHTVSKGMIGECGRRGGYMELLNVPADARAQVEKLLALQLSPNNWGQLMTYFMVARPQPGDASHAAFQVEYDTIFSGLKERATLLVESLNALPGITCNEIEGALYAFPSLNLPDKYKKQAAAKGEAADFAWCMGLLEEQGVVTVPGSGFRQAEGTNHVRLTILPPKHEMADVTTRIATYHKKLMAEYSA
jgi:alanine transaminase